jgi:hypothetical protein
MTDNIPYMSGFKDVTATPGTYTHNVIRTELASTPRQNPIERMLNMSGEEITVGEIQFIKDNYNDDDDFELLKQIFKKVNGKFDLMKLPSYNIQNNITDDVLNLIVWILSRVKCKECANSTTDVLNGKVDYIIPTGGGWKLLLARLKGTAAYNSLSDTEKEYFRINTEAINKNRDSYSRTGSLFSRRGGKSKKARKSRKSRKTRKSRKLRKSRRKH